ncbi:MAG: transposase [Bdellovibrionales bacterium]|nr:transposase [Bdellovibrionales bacterium]
MISRCLLGLIVLATAVGCSQKRDDFVAHPREAAFYNRFVNPSAEFAQAPAKIAQVKLLETDAKYPMRFALYDNNKFYYEVDKLGNGFGQWSYKDGALELVAERVLFDMYLYVSGAQAAGDATLVRFVDRHGQNSLPIQFRNPNALENSGQKPPELPEFTESPKEI